MLHLFEEYLNFIREKNGGYEQNQDPDKFVSLKAVYSKIIETRERKVQHHKHYDEEMANLSQPEDDITFIFSHLNYKWLNKHENNGKMLFLF